MTVEDEVRAASQRFYDALNSTTSGDARAMDGFRQLVGGAAVGGGGLREDGGGPNAVALPGGEMASAWPDVADRYRPIAGEGRLTLTERRLRIFGDVALETGIEDLGCQHQGRLIEGRVRVTNLYRRTADGWKIIHHHADIPPSLALPAEPPCPPSDARPET